MFNFFIKILPSLIIVLSILFLILKRPILGIYLTFILSFFINGIIYWLNLQPYYKYFIYLIILFTFISLHKNQIKFKPFNKFIILFFIYISLSTFITMGINLFFIQNLIGYLFLFFPLYLSNNFNWKEKDIIKFFKLLFIIWCIQLLIASIQKFYLRLPVDLISGSLGRAETQNISVIGSVVFTIGVGSFYFYKKKLVSFFLVISSMYFFIISEAKAGFIFSIMSVSMLPFFLMKKNLDKFKYLFILFFVVLISYTSIFYILPNYFDIWLAADIFSDPELFYNYLYKNYSDRYVRFAAFEVVYYDLLKNPQNLLFGYGLGSMTISPFFGESQFRYDLLYKFSMSSELIIHLIQLGIIGSLLFISILIYLAIEIYTKAKNTNKFQIFLCYVFFTFIINTIISFIFYARPFRAYYLTYLLFLGIGMIYQLNKK